MSQRRTEAQVGLALVAALVILVFGLMWFQEYQVGAQYQRVEVLFEKVGGLGAGDPVDVRGIAMGKVASVNLDAKGVLVVLRLHSDVSMRADAEIRLASAGIMGERMVAVEPGVGAPVDVGSHRYMGVYEAASTELVGQFEKFNEQVLTFIGHADSLLLDLREDRVLVKTLENTTEATGLAVEMLRANRDDMGKIAKNTADLTERFARFLDEHEEGMGEGVEGLARAATTFDSLAAQMSVVLDGTQDILAALKDQRGPAGKMIYDEAAGKDLVETLEKMKFLVDDLQRNPQRYLTVKIF